MDTDVREELFKASLIVVVGFLFTVVMLYFGIEMDKKNIAGRATEPGLYVIPTYHLTAVVFQSISIYCVLAAVVLLVTRKHTYSKSFSELQGYIHRQRLAGFTDSEIRKRLLKLGWPENVIEREFSAGKPAAGKFQFSALDEVIKAQPKRRVKA